jgi:hypothetical protein
MEIRFARNAAIRCVLCIAMVSLIFASATQAWAVPVTARLIAVEGTEVGTSEIDIVRSLVENDLIGHPGVRLLAENDPAFAQMQITATLTRLGHSYILILSARLENGEQRSRKHKVASFDEIDVATERLVAALIEDVDLYATVERGSVLEAEQEPETVVESTLGYELGFGSSWMVTNSLHDHETMWGFHAALVWDVRDVLVDLRTDFQFGEMVDTFVYTTTIGGRYVWHEARRFALYSGVEVGFGYVVARKPSPNFDANGFVVGGNTGILLLRHSDINLDLRARIVLLTESPKNRSLPVLMGVGLGLRF